MGPMGAPLFLRLDRLIPPGVRGLTMVRQVGVVDGEVDRLARKDGSDMAGKGQGDGALDLPEWRWPRTYGRSCRTDHSDTGSAGQGRGSAWRTPGGEGPRWPRLQRNSEATGVSRLRGRERSLAIPYRAKTWVTVGKTPVLVHQGRWPKVSAIGGGTCSPPPEGAEGVRPRVSGDRVPEAPPPAHPEEAGHTPLGQGAAPRSKLVRAFPRQPRPLEVHRHPGHSPELNPEEWFWPHLQTHELASYVPHALTESMKGVWLAVMRARDHPRLLRPFAHVGVRDRRCGSSRDLM